MRNRLAWIVCLGLASFMSLGAAGAAADNIILDAPTTDLAHITCAEDKIDSEYASIGEPNCSVHRVSVTYARQSMASELTRDRMFMD